MIFGPNFCSPVHKTFAPQCTLTPLAIATIRCIEDDFSFANHAMKFPENGENIYHAIQKGKKKLMFV